jgi:hypothetical protein
MTYSAEPARGNTVAIAFSDDNGSSEHGGKSREG